MKRVVLLVLLFVFLPLLAKAEITHPYTVDEKLQVLFGDSTEILVPNADHTATTTYRGLENYTQNYVGGYAHFTFTYTHDRCCYVSRPPSAYITDIDPRTTSTPVERTIYPLLDAPSLYWYGPTDWYLIDVQFDATGFTIVIKQAGINEIWNTHTDVPDLTDSDWVSIVNRYPKNDTPEPSPIPSIYAMAFTPVPIMDTLPPQTIDPVIIIPGIMGSAYKNGKLVIDPILHTYDDLIATLVANGYIEGKDLFTFPYEWRDSNVLSANLLKDKINEVKGICGCSKVDLVAHSMGGLVAREYAWKITNSNRE